MPSDFAPNFKTRKINRSSSGAVKQDVNESIMPIASIIPHSAQDFTGFCDENHCICEFK